MLIQISLRSPNGQVRVQIDDDATLRELVELIRDKTNIASFALRYGYPPAPLDISTPSKLESSIKGLKLRGETIVVFRDDAAPQPQAAPAASAESSVAKPKPFTPKGIEPDETSLEWPERGGHIGRALTHFLSLNNGR